MCDCKVGYFEDKDEIDCAKCPIECETCINSTYCTSCVGDSRFLWSGRCICNKGYYDVKDQQIAECPKCHHKCVTCDSFTNC